jgi:hypothetical protein
MFARIFTWILGTKECWSLKREKWEKDSCGDSEAEDIFYVEFNTN